MVSITDLEMAGCELDNSGVTVPDVCPSAPIIPYKMTTMADLGRDDSKDQKVADHPIDKMNEAEKMDLLKRSILKAQSYTPLFTKKRHINLQNGSTQEHHHRWRLRTLRTAYRHDGSEKYA